RRPSRAREDAGGRVMGGLLQYFQDHPLALPLFLVMFTAIIAVHEFGHYLTARLLGMRVLEFAFGFPPRLLAIRHGGIDYSVNALPFGGFVRILGQDDFSIEQVGAGEPGSFTSKPWWAQAIVLASGVVMNFILAIAVLTVAFAAGTPTSTGQVRVDRVVPGSPAEAAGIQPGDIVRSIDGQPMTKTGDLVNYVRTHADKEVKLELERNGRPVTITAMPRAQPLEGGRLFFVLLGAALRRRISPQVEAAIHAVGFVLLLGLLVVVSVADIRRATGG